MFRGEVQMAEQFHKRLKRLRTKRNLSASELAKLIGVAQSTYSDWENGKGLRIPPYQSISQVLAISVTELITGELPSIESTLKELESLEKRLREIRAKLSSVS